MVEFALLAPVLLLIVMIALDFGRIFLGWVALNNMARVGAYYAAVHPDAWEGVGNVAHQTRYRDLMIANGEGINCELRPAASTPPDPAFPDGTEVGQRAVVALTCGFGVLTPVIGLVIGNVIEVGASATFPISYGCLADCPPPPSLVSPPPPPDNCRTVPDMVGLSVAGARLAWTNAGFVAANFSPQTGDDTRTVSDRTFTTSPDAEPCQTGERWFGDSVSVDLAPVVPPDPSCLTVPNLTGVTVATARGSWTSAGFTGAFIPAPPDHESKIVIGQETTPTSVAGDCLLPDSAVAVVYEPPPPPPPPPPCKVPSFVNTVSSAAVGNWTGAGFASSSLTWRTNKPHPYNIKSQSLVGGTWVSCQSAIQLSN